MQKDLLPGVIRSVSDIEVATFHQLRPFHEMKQLFGR